jgi:hypothetical protein
MLEYSGLMFTEANVRLASIIFLRVVSCNLVEFHQRFEGTYCLHRINSTGLYGVTHYKTIFVIVNAVRISDPTIVTSFHNHPSQTIPTNIANTQNNPTYSHLYE